MQRTNFSIKTIVLSAMVSFMALGAFTTSTATAATAISAAATEQDSGTWVKKSKRIKGGWSIEQRGDQHVISFNNKFKTKNGPDLKVFLSPKTIDSVTGKNATEGAVLVAVLQNNKGSQEYVLPANIDISSFNSLLIHCEEYSILWGGTNIAAS